MRHPWKESLIFPVGRCSNSCMHMSNWQWKHPTNWWLQVFFCAVSWLAPDICSVKSAHDTSPLVWLNEITPLTILYFTSWFSGIWLAKASRAYLEGGTLEGITLDSDDWLCLEQNETSVLPTVFIRKRNFVAKMHFVHKILKTY